ncbi:hypothetical protein [Halalkalirubrum salinum]|uniref:hypothetical protein n=1 Tax=Halalkalirubrum salinum TaxID=2563889 RepID=UPI0010C00C3B|nr:hypothetical protein [Halalkalirubrum salinum]
MTQPSIASSKTYPPERRVEVSASGSTSRIHLPERLVSEVGFTIDEVLENPDFLRDPNCTAKHDVMVAWYYHKEENKAILSDISIYHHPEVELVGVCTLQSLKISDFEAGEHGGARVSLITGFPDELYELRDSNQVVLSAAYAERCSDLDGSFISVYPASLYDQGELPNVDVTPQPTGSRYAHQNSI